MVEHIAEQSAAIKLLQQGIVYQKVKWNYIFDLSFKRNHKILTYHWSKTTESLGGGGEFVK